MPLCPLCSSSETRFLFEAKALRRVREFHRCIRCDLVFVPKKFHVSHEIEKGQYDLHQNEASDGRYMQYLQPVIDLVVRLGEGPILDYGSGPNPVLVETLREKGLPAEGWDPFFSQEKPEWPFRIVTSTEVVEHFSDPAESWEELNQHVLPSGHIVVMTSLTDEVSSLKDWHYIRDITHVSFYSTRTMYWIAERWGYQVSFSGNVSHFKKA